MKHTIICPQCAYEFSLKEGGGWQRAILAELRRAGKPMGYDALVKAVSASRSAMPLQRDRREESAKEGIKRLATRGKVHLHKNTVFETINDADLVDE